MHSKLKPIAAAVPVLERIEETFTARGILPEVQDEGNEHSFDHYSREIEAEGGSVQLQWSLHFADDDVLVVVYLNYSNSEGECVGWIYLEYDARVETWEVSLHQEEGCTLPPDATHAGRDLGLTLASPSRQLTTAEVESLEPVEKLAYHYYEFEDVGELDGDDE